MYENMFKDVQASFRPVMDMVEINQKAAEKMFALQSDYMNSLVNTTLSQIQELTVATDPQQFLDLQVKFFKRIEDQFSEVAEKELATINEASGELSDIVKTNLDSITQSELQYIDEVGKLLTMTGLPDFTAEGAAPAASATTPAITPAATKAAPRTAPKKAATKPAAKKTAAKKTST
ncbi:phasin family protein [Aliamphritea hakodatensis]|uniref:phasin family protein n=1 Tax=Aliamphritea hakodatensis TaxID=2895352 RepID=UPI0022FD4A3D|nr:phasin family protein [Aliamphritea hakodatensis]